MKKIELGVKNILSSGVFCLILSSLAFAADTFQMDPTHSSIGFAVQHLVVSTTKGEFTNYQATIRFDSKNPEATEFDIVIQAASIDTRVKQRDDHLRTSDFLDVENHPTITFKSKGVKKEGAQFLVKGDLTIRGVTKEITVPTVISGPVVSPFGSTVIGVSGQFTLNRQDFGVSWNKQMDQGGYVVGDQVTIDVHFEAAKQ